MTVLASFNWGSSPKIPLTFAYEHQRSGADMQYRVQVTIGTLSTDASYFGYPIYMKLTIGGVLRETTTLKAASPNQWGSPITYTSPWYTVTNLTSGSAVVSFNMYSGSGCTRNDTFSYSMAVDPAASKLSAPAGTLGTGLVLAVTKYNSSFTHTISWVCGSAKGDVCVQASNPSITWDAAHGNTVALASQNTAGQSVTVSFIITTYSGSSVVGTDSASCVMAIPAGVKPSVTVSVSDAAGLFATYGAYIQGHSRLAITANPQTAHGSPITGYAITADGHSYYYNPVTTEVLQNTGNLRITAVVTDARTRPSEPGTADITVLEYARPSVTVNAYRCNEAGNADQEGEYMKVGFNASITSLNGKNSASYTIKYNQSGGSVKTITGKGLSYLSDKISCDKTTAWEVEVTVSDNLTSSVKSAVIPIAFTLMEFYKTGRGVSLGKVAVRDGFDCAMDAYFGGKRLQEVGSPTVSTDAVNLGYALSAFAPAKADTTYPSCYYRMVDGVKEWINPPMASGVEYRTTERWQGKPVYTKIISFGKLPNAASAYVNWGPDSGTVAYVVGAVAVTNTGSAVNIIDSANLNSVWVVTKSDYSSYTAFVTLKYVKV